MRPTASVVCLALLGLLLAGCDPAVQARYQPTSVDEVFGPFTRIGGVAEDVYELPSAAPAEDPTEQRERICRPPGQRLKPVDLVGIRDDRPRFRTNEPTLLAGMYEPPPRSLPPMPPYPIASWQQPTERGAKEKIWTPPYAPKLEPGKSIHRNPPVLTGGYRTDIYIWCNDAANQRR